MQALIEADWHQLTTYPPPCGQSVDANLHWLTRIYFRSAICFPNRQDSKLSKQNERLHGLGELLEERDVQLAELTSARRDREKLRVKLADLEDGEMVEMVEVVGLELEGFGVRHVGMLLEWGNSADTLVPLTTSLHLCLLICHCQKLGDTFSNECQSSEICLGTWASSHLFRLAVRGLLQICSHT